MVKLRGAKARPGPMVVPHKPDLTTALSWEWDHTDVWCLIQEIMDSGTQDLVINGDEGSTAKIMLLLSHSTPQITMLECQ